MALIRRDMQSPFCLIDAQQSDRDTEKYGRQLQRHGVHAIDKRCSGWSGLTGKVMMDSDVYQYRRDECFMDQVAVGCDKGDGQDLI